MNKKILFLFSVLFCLHQIVADEIVLQRVLQENVDQKTARIERDLFNNSVVRNAIVGTGVALTGIIFYKLLYGSKSAPLPVATAVQQAAVPNDQKLGLWAVSVLHRAEARNQQIDILLYENGVGVPIFSWAWLKSWVKFFGRQYVVSSIAFAATSMMSPFNKYFKKFDAAIDNVIDTIFHPADINWFMDTRCGVFNVCNRLHKDVECVVLYKSGPLKNQDYFLQRYAQMWNICVAHVESILGFMQAKMKRMAHLPAQEKEVAESDIALLQKRTNEYSERLEYFLNNPVSFEQAQQVGDIITDFEKLINEHMNRFALLEVLAQK